MRQLVGEAEFFSGCLQDTQPFGDDFAADAIALYDSDFESGHSADSISTFTNGHERLGPTAARRTRHASHDWSARRGRRVGDRRVCRRRRTGAGEHAALHAAEAGERSTGPSGLWQVLNTATWDLQDHGARLGVPAGKGVVTGNELPYKPEALAKKKENEAKHATLDPESKCYLSGVPRITFMPFPFQIVQQADKVNILYEYNHTIRQIYMNGNPHPAGHIDWWMGDSRGRWDGNTLVVDASTSAKNLVRSRGQLPQRLAAHRRAVHADQSVHLRYDVTIEDPKVFTRPWNISAILYRRIDPNVELLEYECYAYQSRTSSQQVRRMRF